MKFILTAMPGKFTLKYRKKNGEVKTYSKVVPMETLDNALVAYVFNTGENRPGIRRFNQEGILDIQEVK